MIKKILLIFVLFISNVYANEKFEEGIDFELMTDRPSEYQQKKSDKINVVEAFWYGCPHCYVFDDYLIKWKKEIDDDVSIVSMPVVFNKPWLLHARAFYTIHELENSSELHKNFFYAYHEQARTFPSKESIINFLVSQGENAENVSNIFSSEKVSKKVQEANYMLETYKIDSVPAIIINDKYKISGRMAKSYERMIKISKHIIDLERQKRAN